MGFGAQAGHEQFHVDSPSGGGDGAAQGLQAAVADAQFTEMMQHLPQIGQAAAGDAAGGGDAPGQAGQIPVAGSGSARSTT